MIRIINAKISTFLDFLRGSLWVIPSIMVVSALFLGWFLPGLDRELGLGAGEGSRWISSGSPEGARALLTTVAGSTITVAGVVFSITIVALTMATTQFGPRLLRNFMRDRGNQLVMGVFIATFLYSLVVLKSIRNESIGVFVPHVSISFALGLAIASIGCLIYFIHHISSSIQADVVVRKVCVELNQTLLRLYPERLREADGADENGNAEMGRAGKAGRSICARKTGYVQFIDEEPMIELAKEHDGEVFIDVVTGDFVVEGSTIGEICGLAEGDENSCKTIESSIVSGSLRTPLQDISFSIYQLVEIALRALSPGINDPVTAELCIDRLSGVYCELAQRSFGRSILCDDAGKPRVMRKTRSFTDLLHAGFNPLLDNAAHHVGVYVKSAESLVRIAGVAKRTEDFQGVESLTQRIREIMNKNIEIKKDTEAIEALLQKALKYADQRP